MANTDKLNIFLTEFSAGSVEVTESHSPEKESKNDYFTHQYEVVKRKGETLSEEIKTSKNKFLKAKKEFKHLFEWNKEKSKETKKIERLENKIDVARKKLSSIRKNNKNLQSKIENIRFNNYGAKKEGKKLSCQIIRTKNQAEDFNNLFKRNQSVRDSTKTKLSKLNKSFQERSYMQEERASRLQQNISSQIKSMTPTPARRVRTPHHEIKDYLNCLKFLSAQWSRNVQDKKDQLAEYRDYINQLEKGFKVMGNALCSDSLAEIEKANLDSYEQEWQLRSNLVKLSESIDKVENKLSKTKSKIQMLSKGEHSKDNKIVSELKSQTNRLNEMSKQLHKRTEEMNQEIQDISPVILSNLQALEDLNIPPLTQNFQNDPKITTPNIVIHLSKLEELVTVLLASLNMQNTQTPNTNKSYSSIASKVNSSLQNIEITEGEDHLPFSQHEIRLRAKKHFANLLSS